jgi:hypothetical protein
VQAHACHAHGIRDDARTGEVPADDTDSYDALDERPTEAFPAVGPLDANAHSAAAVARPARGSRRGTGALLRGGLASHRLRIVGWFVVLLALGTLATVFVLGYLLNQRIDDGIRQELARETEEFQALSGGNDPMTGQPFGTDVQRMFEVFLEGNIPNRNEVFVTYLDGELHERSPNPVLYELEQDPTYVERTAAISEVASGRMDSPFGAIEYLALPVRVDGVTRGVLSVANFRDIEQAE